jgi:hypothetical protein
MEMPALGFSLCTCAIGRNVLPQHGLIVVPVTGMFKLPEVQDDPAFEGLIASGGVNIVCLGELDRSGEVRVWCLVLIKHRPIVVILLFG